MTDFKMYQTMTDGGYVEVRYNGQETFRQDEVFIIEHNETRRLFIWVGSQAPVRKKFISSQIASQLRMTLGLTYKITNVEEGMETSEFLKVIKQADGLDLSPEQVSQVRTEQPTKTASSSLFNQIEEAGKDIVENKVIQRAPVKTDARTPSRTSPRPTPARTSSRPTPARTSSRPTPARTSSRPVPMKKTQQIETVQDTEESTALEVNDESRDNDISIMKDFVLKTIESSSPNLDNYHEAGVEETVPVSKDQARRIIDNRSIDSDKRVVLNRIFISFKGNSKEDNSLEFYESMDNDLESDCTYKVPTVKLFLNNSQSGSNLLHIVLSQGSSLYYTCPGGIYFSLMFAEV